MTWTRISDPDKVKTKPFPDDDSDPFKQNEDNGIPQSKTRRKIGTSKTRTILSHPDEDKVSAERPALR